MTIYEPGTTYGEGGWKPDTPGENIVQTVTNNGDGTGTRTVFDADGGVISSEQVAVPVVEASNEDRIAELEATVSALLTIIEGGA